VDAATVTDIYSGFSRSQHSILLAKNQIVMLQISMENTLISNQTPSKLTKQDAMKRNDLAAGRILHHCSGAGGERAK